MSNETSALDSASKKSAFSEIGFKNVIGSIKEEIQTLYASDDVPWVIGYSGGKDSSAILQLVWYALRDLKPESRKKTVYVISTDTLVESPVVSAWVSASLSKMEAAAKEQGLPIQPRQLTPELDNTFWVNLIGKGYPAPRPKFRWCTERMKIQPSTRFIRDIVRANGQAILVLGTRKAESAIRHRNMLKHEAKRVRERLAPNASMPNSLIYTPIEDWTNDDVWLFLMQVKNPWDHSNKDLLSMYRGASADGECPLVVDATTPTCGSSRFGCWVCTMVDRDRSMEAMIQNDEEKEWMTPLLEIRNELDPRNKDGKPDDNDRRDWRRMNGSLQFFERNLDGKTSIEPVFGPYTKTWREHWLRRVLEAQTFIRKNGPPHVRNLELLRIEELNEIRKIWLEEKHEFDDSLPRIYMEVTGELFPAQRGNSNGLGAAEWDLLKEICESDELHMELVVRLLDTERKYQSMARRTGIYEALEKCFSVSAYASKEEAIDIGLRKRELRAAVENIESSQIKAELQKRRSEDDSSKRLN